MKEWLETAGKQGWIVLTRDKNIRRKPNELRAFRDYKVIGFVLTSGDASAGIIEQVLGLLGWSDLTLKQVTASSKLACTARWLRRGVCQAAAGDVTRLYSLCYRFNTRKPLFIHSSDWRAKPPFELAWAMTMVSASFATRSLRSAARSLVSRCDSVLELTTAMRPSVMAVLQTGFNCAPATGRASTTTTGL